MTIRKFYTFRVNDSTPEDHTGRLGEITYRDGFLYYHNGSTPGGEIIGGGGSGSGGPTSWSSITGKPSFATVATSGSYADLTNKPTIPSLDGYATEAWVNEQGFSSGSGSNPFDQDLNTTDSVTFADVIVNSSAGILNADGQRITNSYYNGTLLVGSNMTQTPVSILIGGAGPRNEWAFTPDGKLTTPGGLEIFNEGDPTNNNVINSNTGLALTSIGPDQLRVQWTLGETTLPDIPSADIINTVMYAGYSGLSIEVIDTEYNSNVWSFRSNGILRLPEGGDIVDRNGNSVLGGTSGATTLSALTDVALEGPVEGSVLTWNSTAEKWENRNLPSISEITNTNSDPYQPSTYSVSVSSTGIVTMTTARGSLEFGAQPEEGAPQHLHIMRPADQGSSTDLYFGDDYNYVKLPGNYGAGTLGVDIGANDGNGGAQQIWRFGTDGNLTLPAGGDIKDSNGVSVLGGSGSTTHMGNSTTFMDVDLDDDIVRMQTTNTNWIADYSFDVANGGFTSATWENGSIVIAGPSVDVYTAVWALTDFSTIDVTINGMSYEVTNAGSSTPGHPQDVTLWTNSTPPAAGPNVIDSIYIVIRTGVESYVEVDGNDVRIEASDDVRIFSNDTFELVNRSSSDPIQITVDDNNSSKTFQFKVDGNLELPAGGTIVDSNGNNLLSAGGTTLPADASGYLNNDGSGTLSWVPGNPSGSGMLPYNGVTVLSNTVVGDWTEYALSGTMDAFYDWNNTYTTITLSSQTAYGKEITPNTKNLWINDSKINSNDYLVIEFPSNPTVGDVFSVPMVNQSTIVNASSFVVGKTYTIVSVGDTNWTSIGAQYNGNGISFVATGVGSGTGTASTVDGAQKVIFKPATGQRAQTMAQGSLGSVVFGQGGTYDFMYIDLGGQNAGNPVTWVYAGVINSIPTWYQFYF